MTCRKKLIEVALPLDAINRESAREKSIRHGHPSTLHLWWARRPLAACRAVIFSSLVDDPDEPNAPKEYLEALDKLEKPPTGADGRRERLFYFIERLVKWESTTDEKLLDQARKLIRLSCEGKPPPVLDPFCGGGSIPLEAQRLGLEAYASDLNPVAVLITKALIEIPPKFAGKPPVNPDDRTKLQEGAAWKGAAGLATDVRYYGKWMRDRAWEKIGRLYPKGPNGETVIAWLWARTVKCPNPACGAQMPLIRSFALSTRKGHLAAVEPVVDRQSSSAHFQLIPSGVSAKEGTVGRRGIQCIFCAGEFGFADIREMATRTKFGSILMAAVAEGARGRLYFLPDESHVDAATNITRPNIRDLDLPEGALGFRIQNYGFTTWGELFTDRQLVALTTLSDLIKEATDLVQADADGDDKYAQAVSMYLSFAVDRFADKSSTLAWWQAVAEKMAPTFTRPVLPMVWDYAELNPFCASTGNFGDSVKWVSEAVEVSTLPSPIGSATQLDATEALVDVKSPFICTDPPYYDNIGYADLSDFFYLWLRRTVGDQYRDLFATLVTPKTGELIASPGRFEGDRSKADRHFEDGLRTTFGLMEERVSPDYPLTMYYAFKQAEAGDSKSASALVSTGWQTMLSGLIEGGLRVVGTWPIRTERSGRIRSHQSNALASSIVLVCRARQKEAPAATFKQFQAELGRELPEALSVMTGRNREDHSEPWVDPIDLRQAAIGPGMAVYSRYSRVQKADGSALSVRDALQEINEAIDAYFDEVEGELDRDTRFCSQWYRENGFNDGTYGRAEVLAQAMDIGVEALGARGLLLAKAGKVRLVRPLEYRAEMPAGPSIWELCHRLVGALEEGEEATARLYNAMPGLAEEARDLAYRLYLEAEKKNRAEDALGYNALVASWTDVRRKATELREESQAALL